MERYPIPITIDSAWGITVPNTHIVHKPRVSKLVYVNPITNTPGTMNPGRAGSVVFRRNDDVKVVYCHVTDIRVSVGETVRAGDVVAKVGNNGWTSVKIVDADFIDLTC